VKYRSTPLFTNRLFYNTDLHVLGFYVGGGKPRYLRKAFIGSDLVTTSKKYKALKVNLVVKPIEDNNNK